MLGCNPCGPGNPKSPTRARRSHTDSTQTLPASCFFSVLDLLSPKQPQKMRDGPVNESSFHLPWNLVKMASSAWNVPCFHLQFPLPRPPTPNTLANSQSTLQMQHTNFIFRPIGFFTTSTWVRNFSLDCYSPRVFPTSQLLIMLRFVFSAELRAIWGQGPVLMYCAVCSSVSHPAWHMWQLGNWFLN